MTSFYYLTFIQNWFLRRYLKSEKSNKN